MARRSNITKEQLLLALNSTKSTSAAARYMGITFNTIRKWMRFYDSTTHSNLLEEYAYRGGGKGSGSPKFLSMRNEPKLLDIIEGRAPHSTYTAKRLKYRLVEEGYLPEECAQCGYCERRITDYKVPLLLRFKDKNKLNWRLDNLELDCYNCFFLHFGDTFNKYEIKHLEDTVNVPSTKLSEIVDMGMDDYTLERLKEISESGNDNIIEEDYNIVALKYGKNKTQEPRQNSKGI